MITAQRMGDYGKQKNLIDNTGKLTATWENNGGEEGLSMLKAIDR